MDTPGVFAYHQKQRFDSTALESQTRWLPRRKSVSPPIDTQATASPSPSCVELSRSGDIGGDTQRLQALAQSAAVIAEFD
jgi:hypothetical protein